MFRHILRLIRLFRDDRSGMDKSLLTAGKGSGTGVYAEIFVSLILHFFLFNLLICIFFFVTSLIFSILFFYNHSIYARSFYLIKLIFNFFLFIYFIYILYFFLPATFTHTHTHDPRPLPTTHDI